MKRAIVWLSAAWICGACSSDGGGGDDPALSNAGTNGSTPAGGGSANNQGGSSSEVPSAPPLTLESVSPEDGASEVALETSIELRFSAELDPATVTSSSVVVQGPNGPLVGELTVNGNVVRFGPVAPLPLLTRVRVSLGTALASIDGGTLAEPIESQFQSRDGVFREPLQINAGAAVSLFLRGNDTGDLIATWTDLQVVSSVEAMVFDGGLGSWTPAQLIEDNNELTFSQPVAAVAPNGDSIVAWRGGGWTRYAGAWSAATVDAGITLPSVALAQGTALAVANVDGNASYQLLPDGVSEWTPAQTLLMSGRVDAIEALAGGFIAIGTREGSLVASQLSEAGGAWSEFVSLATIAELAGLRLTTHGDSAAVSWVDLREGPVVEGEEPSASAHPFAQVFTADAWSAALELPEGADLPWVSVTTDGRALAVWTQLDAVSASSYSPDQGWAAPEQLDERSQLGPTGAVDGAGNLMALWPSSEQIMVQRRPEAGAWQELAPLDSQVTVALWSHVDRQGRVNLVWQNGSGIWWTRFE